MSDKKKFPRTGFGRLAGDMVRRYYTHDVARDSAALTYYLLFAIFPLLIFISTLLGLLELDGAYIASVLEPLLPADVLNVLQSYLDYVSANQSRQLLWFSLVFSIWFPMRAAGCLMHSVRKAFGCGAPESMWRSQLRILLFTVCLILSIAITLVLVVVGRTVLEFAGRIITVSEAFITAWSYLRFVALALVMTVLLVLLYMLSQGRRRPLREVLPGVGSTLAAWLGLRASEIRGLTWDAGGMAGAEHGLLLLCGACGTIFRAVRLHRHGDRGAAVAVHVGADTGTGRGVLRRPH